MNLHQENTSIIIGRIIARSIAGNITSAEQALLDEWLLDDAHRQVYEAIRNHQPIGESLSSFDDFDVVEGFERFQASVVKKAPFRFRRWMAAAILMIFLAVSATVYFVAQKAKSSVELVSNKIDDVMEGDVAPGGNRATLTLADGRIITLDEAQSGIVIEDDEITYNNGEQLAEVAGDIQKVVLLELSTPKGGTYQVVLPDGTNVWLNAGSTLRYPSKFLDADRTVELSGEAYFSVVTNPEKPFKVVSAKQSIYVLGTEFNVSAYPDDPEIKTTLVEGKVRLSLTDTGKTEADGVKPRDDQSVELRAGEQGIIHGKTLTKTPIDVEPYTAWKEGYFNFRKTPLEEILRQAARWYDVQVVYQNGIPSETFSGDIKRNVSLRGLLDILRHSTINISLEENTLIVQN